MIIKKLMLGALAAATMATSIGVANTPVFAAEESNVQVMATEASTIKAHPDSSLKDETSFNHNGFTYNYNSSEDKYYGVPVANASQVTDLFMYSHLFDKEVVYSYISLEDYTSVERVVIHGNSPTYAYVWLQDLTNQFDLYLTGQCAFNSYVTDLNIRDIYFVCPYYGSSETIIEANWGNLNGSKVRSLKYSQFSGLGFWYYNKSKVSDLELTNVDGELLTLTEVQNSELPYSMDTFYPFEGYQVTPMYLGASGYYECFELSNDGLIQDKLSPYIRSLDTKVKTLYLDCNFDASNLPYNMEAITLVVPNYNGQNFMNKKGGEIVIVNNYADTYNMTALSYFKTIRFINLPNSNAGGVVWNGMGTNDNYTVNIEKVLLPSSYAESHYKPIYDDDILAEKIETYDDSTYVIPTRSSFLSDNGNIYEVENQALKISYLEEGISVMSAAGQTPTTDTPVDVQIAAYYAATYPETPEQPEVNNGITFEDESEWTTGINTIGTLMYASDKSLEDVVKLASNFMVWEDGELADPTEYDIICNIVGERLSITVKQDGQIKKSVNIYIQAVPAEYGEFIYVEMLGTSRGVLLTDIDESRTTNINNLYDYVMANAINYDLFNDVEIEEYSFAEGHLDTVDSYYRHRIAQKYFQTSTMIITQDHDLLMDTTNLDLTTTGIINPDDDIEDAETEYDVKYIDTIYAPATMNGKIVPYLLDQLLVTKDGQPVTENVTVSISYDGSLPNNEDYSFRLYVRLPDDCRYEKEVNVKVLDGTSNVAYVVFNDGSIIAVYHVNADHTVETLTNQINGFLTNTLKVAEPNVNIPADTNLASTKTYTGFTYGDNKDLTVIHSGVAMLNYSTADRPVDDSVFKEGYSAMTNIYFTDNYNVNDVVKAIGNKLLLKEGVQVDGEYRVESTVYKDTIAWTFYINDVKVYSCQVSYSIISDSEVGNFIYADAFRFHTGILLLEKGNENTFADIYNQVIKSCKYTIEEPTTSKSLDLSSEGQTVVREVHQLGDYNYYNFETTVYVVDFASEVEDSQTEIITPTPNPGEGTQTPDDGEGEGNIGDKVQDTIDDIKDKTNEWLEDFKQKVEENKALKAATIAFGCITGILLLYGIYVIFKKLFRWLGR